MEIGFSLGSNLGDRLAHLRRARDELAWLPGIALLASAPVYETEPVDVRGEFVRMMFLNTVVVTDCVQDVFTVGRLLRSIEDQLGRTRTADRNAPRTIDIDILYCGDRVIHEQGLQIPHPRWHERRFVVQPLADVRPDLVLPGQSLPVHALLARLPQTPTARVYAAEW